MNTLPQNEGYVLMDKQGKDTKVIYCFKNQKEELFSGNRWVARQYVRELKDSLPYEGCRFFNQKAGRRGYPGIVVELFVNGKSL